MLCDVGDLFFSRDGRIGYEPLPTAQHQASDTPPNIYCTWKLKLCLLFQGFLFGSICFSIQVSCWCNLLSGLQPQVFEAVSTSDLSGDDALPGKPHRYINGTVEWDDGPEKSGRLGDPLDSPWIHVMQQAMGKRRITRIH